MGRGRRRRQNAKSTAMEPANISATITHELEIVISAESLLGLYEEHQEMRRRLNETCAAVGYTVVSEDSPEFSLQVDARILVKPQETTKLTTEEGDIYIPTAEERVGPAAKPAAIATAQPAVEPNAPKTDKGRRNRWHKKPKPKVACVAGMRPTNEMIYAFPEDIGLMQFWYNEDTVRAYSKEIGRLIETCGNDKARIAFISCPSIFRWFYAMENKNVQVNLFEYDTRFDIYDQYRYYDYNKPLDFPIELRRQYSIIMLDPPMLNRDCLEKMSRTVHFLANPNALIILSTGSQMEEAALELLCVSKTHFVPKHGTFDGVKLQSKFACFTNYGSGSLPNNIITNDEEDDKFNEPVKEEVQNTTEDEVSPQSNVTDTLNATGAGDGTII